MIGGLCGKTECMGTNIKLKRKIPELINPFIDSANLAVSIVEKTKNSTLPSDYQLVFFLFVFGALDDLCQILKIGQKDTLDILNEIVLSQLGNGNKKLAKGFFKIVVETSSKNEGEGIMRIGGQAHSEWRRGDSMAPVESLSRILDAMF